MNAGVQCSLLQPRKFKGRKSTVKKTVVQDSDFSEDDEQGEVSPWDQASDESEETKPKTTEMGMRVTRSQKCSKKRRMQTMSVQQLK